MAIDKIFNDANVDGIADNIFGAVNNSVSEVKAMQQRKAAENVQMVVEAFKKIETNITEKFDNVSNVIEKRVLTIKDGRDGSSGSDGRNGRDGKPGRDGVNGKQGTPGTPGKDGTDGVDGVSVTDANIDFDGSLVISLSSGQQINVGEVVAPDLAEKIKIVSTMSTNGAVGIKDEGSSISTGVKIINFVGANVTATNSGDDVTVNVSAGTGTVTSVAATVPAFLSVAGSPITTTGTLAISLSGTALPVANGGTSLTTLTANNVILGNGASAPTFVAPSTSGNVLTSNGTTWSSTAPATSGTVTSVAMTVPSVLSISGSPITSSGTLALTYSGTALPVANGGTGLTAGTSGGVLAYTAAGTLASSAALAASALVIGGGAGAAPSTTTTGTGVVTALGVNTGTAGAFVVNGGALGSPSTAGTMPAFTLGGTVSGGGNQINNVVIGTSTPLAGAFTTLSASSTATITAAGGTFATSNLILKDNVGSPAGYVLANAGATYIGTTSAATSYIAVTSTGLAVTGELSTTGVITATYGTASSATFGANQVIRVDSNANAGYGIGVPSSGGIVGGYYINAGANSYDGGIEYQGTTRVLSLRAAGTNIAAVSSTALALGVGISLTGGTSGTGYSFSGSAPANSLTLDSSGNLGLGTTNPSVASGLGIVVNGGAGQPRIALKNTNTGDASGDGFQLAVDTSSNAYIDQRENAALIFNTNNAERARIDSSGNLGLGVTPSAWVAYKALQVGSTGGALSSSSSSDFEITTNAYYSGGWLSQGAGVASSRYRLLAGAHAWWNAPSGTAGNAISFTQAMTLDASGFLFLGCTTTPSASVKGIRLTPDFTTNTPKFSTGSATGLVYMIEWINGNGIVGSISTNGSLTSYNVSSDYRLKNITGPITTSGAYIDSLKPVEGTWKADNSTFVGLIAHEVQEASRTNVATGTKDGEQMQGMDYSSAEIIANLVAELQSLRARVAQLESKP